MPGFHPTHFHEEPSSAFGHFSRVGFIRKGQRRSDDDRSPFDWLQARGPRLTVLGALDEFRRPPTWPHAAGCSASATSRLTRSNQGRIERLWATLKDRLISGLRLRPVATSDAANAYLPNVITAFNRRFTRRDAHARRRLAPPAPDLDLIMSCRYTPAW